MAPDGTNSLDLHASPPKDAPFGKDLADSYMLSEAVISMAEAVVVRIVVGLELRAPGVACPRNFGAGKPIFCAKWLCVCVCA